MPVTHLWYDLSTDTVLLGPQSPPNTTLREIQRFLLSFQAVTRLVVKLEEKKSTEAEWEGVGNLRTQNTRKQIPLQIK